MECTSPLCLGCEAVSSRQKVIIRSGGRSKLNALTLRAGNLQRLIKMALLGPFFNQGKTPLTAFGADNCRAKCVYRDFSHLLPRDGEVDMPDDSPSSLSCRALCSAKTTNQKRGWLELEAQSSLVKRVFDPFPPLENNDRGRDLWMISACDKLKKPEQEVVPGWADANPGYASIATAALADQPVRFGMQQICGCTMLFVVSRKRVYLGVFPSSA